MHMLKFLIVLFFFISAAFADAPLPSYYGPPGEPATTTQGTEIKEGELVTSKLDEELPEPYGAEVTTPKYG
ncbi:UNVERIFIED_CONTAM: hypothetical protein RMT77_002339 [Armadillidium vulgare]